MRRILSDEDARIATLGKALDYADVPVHVRQTNQELRNLLETPGFEGLVPSEGILREALADRKVDRCPACRDGRGEHIEPAEARVSTFTPGVAGGV